MTYRTVSKAVWNGCPCVWPGAPVCYCATGKCPCNHVKPTDTKPLEDEWGEE